MFKLFRKNLNFTVFKTTSIHRLFPRISYSSQAASGNCFTVSYLIDSFGFPPDKAISASKYLNIKTPDRADSVIAFFKKQGFTEPQISHLVRKFPVALICNPEKNFLPKFEFLSSIGLSDSDIIKFLTASPSSLGRSLKNHIQPTFTLLKDLLQSNDRTLVALKRYPWLFVSAFQSNMIRNIQFLRDVGVPASKMLYVLTYQTRCFLVSEQQFKKTVEEVVEMGFDPLSSSFMLAIHAIRSMSKSTWKKKMDAYEKWGLSKAEILLAFRANPWCMLTSEEKIDKVMDYLVNKMGFETSIIAKHCSLISYSMEKRIIPRCLVYNYCLDNGLMKDENYRGLISWLKLSESMFMKKLERYDTKAPGVLKFYQEKMDHVN